MKREEIEKLEIRIEKEVGVDVSNSFDNELDLEKNLVIQGKVDLEDYLSHYRNWCGMLKEMGE